MHEGFRAGWTIVKSRRYVGYARLLLVGVCVVALLGGPALPRVQSAAKGPNILIVLADDLRWDALGAYGNGVVKTPNLDRLAEDGARLDAFYVAAPLCTPSRAAFLSGLYPHQSDILDILGKADFDPGTATIATHLNTAGYVTGFVGKAHMGGDPRRWGFKVCPIWLPSGSSPHKDPRLLVNGLEETVAGHITQIFADAAIRFLERHRADRWLLWLATTAPHTPYYHDPKFSYRAAEITPPPGWPKGERFRAADWPGYYSTISMLDEQVGRVLRRLDELGLAKDTLVFVTADNGEMFGSHGHQGKQMWFEESARVPALVRWPGTIRPGTHVVSPISSVDLLPTVLELVGKEQPKTLEGVSMLPALTGGTPLRSAAYSEANRRAGEGGGYWRMIRTDRWKYVNLQYVTSRHRGERLYDLKNDPSELKDLAKSKEHGKVLLQMRQQLDRWIDATCHDRGAIRPPDRRFILCPRLPS